MQLYNFAILHMQLYKNVQLSVYNFAIYIHTLQMQLGKVQLYSFATLQMQLCKKRIQLDKSTTFDKMQLCVYNFIHVDKKRIQLDKSTTFDKKRTHCVFTYNFTKSAHIAFEAQFDKYTLCKSTT